MLNLKKTAVAVLALGSSAVFAGSMGPVCTPGNVTVPCASTAWDFAAQALYLQPTYTNGFNYMSYGTAGTTRNYQSADPAWGWGFKLEASYHFNTGNDLDVNWYRVHNTNNTTINYTGLTSTSANIGRSPQWDAVNVEFGQKVNFGEQSTVRFHGGVEYARVASNNSVSPINSSNALYLTNSSTYNGFGPRLGADLGYDVGNGFSVYGNGAGSLLIGNTGFNGNVYNNTGLVSSVNGSHNALVPELEAKLGAMYTCAMAQGDLSIDAGWMWVNYLNIQESAGLFPVTTGGLDNSDVGKSINFGEQGPFVGLKWLGNV